MGYVNTYAINGSEITFADFRVVLDPLTIDVDNPDFIAALRRAPMISAELVNIHFICMFSNEYVCDDMYEAERALHRMFVDKRINGEWFDLSDEDVAHIKAIGTA